MQTKRTGEADSGPLDRFITIEQPVKTQGAAGGKESTWAVFAVGWASIVPQQGAEYYAVNQMNATDDIVFRVRFINGLRRDMRIQHNGAPYDIISFQEIGRGQWLDILARVKQAV